MHQGKENNFLIVGTKYQAANVVASACIKARCHYVNKKWLGGMLTNRSTIEKCLQQFKELKNKEKTGILNQLLEKDTTNLTSKVSGIVFVRIAKE